MIRLIFSLLILSNSLYAQVDHLKWHLIPEGQEVKIEIDDLHTDTILASQAMDFGFSRVVDYTLNRDIKVAVIDGGIDYTHPQLVDFFDYKSEECFEGTIIPNMENDNDSNGYMNDCLGWNFANDNNNIDDEDGHGTHVTGLITDLFIKNKSRLKIIPIKVFSGSNDHKPLAEKLYNALSYALEEKVNIIHLSLGWPKSIMNFKLETIINEIHSNGIAIVSAAGNSKQRSDIYPCKIDSVICIGALKANSKIANFSNYGPQVDFMMAGEKILSTIPMSHAPLYIPIKGYDYKNGTSQAAPLFTGALAFLMAKNPELTVRQAYLRLLSTAQKSSHSLRGNINLDEAIKSNSKVVVYPSFKNLNTIVKIDNEYTFDITIQNSDLLKVQEAKFRVNCSDKDFDFSLNVLPGASKTQKVKIAAGDVSVDQLSCKVTLQDQVYSFTLKVLKDLPTASQVFEISSSQRFIFRGKYNTASRLRTIEGINKSIELPIYMYRSKKGIEILSGENAIGNLVDKKGCKTLRIVQDKFNNVDTRFILHESICEDKFLTYDFYDHDLNPLFDTIKFTPTLTVINFEDLTIHLEDNLPIFKFINNGIDQTTQKPWEVSTDNHRRRHFYLLKVEKKGNSSLLKEYVLDDFNLWIQTLKFRYIPKYHIILRDEDRLLVSIDHIKYWVDINTMVLANAGLSQLLFGNDTFTKLNQDNITAMQGLITPYSYRAALSNNVILRYESSDLGDPLSKILDIKETPSGYTSYIQSYYNLHTVNFNFNGEITSIKKQIVERFDFLKGEELNSLVYSFRSKDEMIIYLDGSHIHTNYIDIISKSKTSYRIPENCTTQLPVQIDDEYFLALACIKEKKQLLTLIPFNTL